FLVLAHPAMPSDEVQKLGARAGVRAEMSEQLTRNHRHAPLADAAGRHALVCAFNDGAHPLRLHHDLNAMSDLHGHRFLHLETAGEGLDDASELADADDLAVRQITDVDLAHDGRHVVLAVRLETDVAEHDHFVVAVDL